MPKSDFDLDESAAWSSHSSCRIGLTSSSCTSRIRHQDSLNHNPAFVEGLVSRFGLHSGSLFSKFSRVHPEDWTRVWQALPHIWRDRKGLSSFEEDPCFGITDSLLTSAWLNKRHRAQRGAGLPSKGCVH